MGNPRHKTMVPDPMENTPNTNPNSTGSALARISKDGEVNLQNLTPEEAAKYSALSRNLSPGDANSILNYGTEVQSTMEKYSNEFLEKVRTQQGGEVGEQITELLKELNYIDVDELNQNAFQRTLSKIPFLKKLVFDVKKMFQKYDTVLGNVDKITAKIKAGRLHSIKDNSSLQTMFDSNLQAISQMEELIISGQIRFVELKQQLENMEANSEAHNDYEIADMREFISRLDKRLADLKVVRFIMMQSLAQIRVVQNNNTAIAEKAQSIVSTTLPVWKNQLTIAVALQRQKGNVEMQRKVSETTNTILEKNAELLKQNSIEVAREAEKTVVSVETLKRTTASLIDTLNEVKKIHEEGEISRRALDKDLQSLEGELRKNVTRIS